MNADSRSTGRGAVGLVEEPVAACVRCPACGSEECLMLQDLGNFCSTMTAVSVASRGEDLAKGCRGGRTHGR